NIRLLIQLFQNSIGSEYSDSKELQRLQNHCTGSFKNPDANKLKACKASGSTCSECSLEATQSAAFIATPLKNTAATSGSTVLIRSATNNCSTHSRVDCKHLFWLGQCAGSPSTAGPSRNTMRWNSGFKAF